MKLFSILVCHFCPPGLRIQILNPNLIQWPDWIRIWSETLVSLVESGFSVFFAVVRCSANPAPDRAENVRMFLDGSGPHLSRIREILVFSVLWAAVPIALPGAISLKICFLIQHSPVQVRETVNEILGPCDSEKAAAAQPMLRPYLDRWENAHKYPGSLW